ncbi:hypothetical protein AGLY_016430 [Aphis glycines]|uniref:Uncharacterized protein n=1 Tax=Aphis glycines TaxID=307491 RepID=A0A6G0SZW7_APHGL|nr:hypothetical protein AGLY_016430 [Aphis glycines]
MVTLKGVVLLITPADESTKEAIVSIAKEGFGITETGNYLPRIIIYDVDRDIAPEVLMRKIVEQNTELGITDEEIFKFRPRFRTGPKDNTYVHWVLEVQPEVLNKIVNKRINISLSACNVREYLNISVENSATLLRNAKRPKKYAHTAHRKVTGENYAQTKTRIPDALTVVNHSPRGTRDVPSKQPE